MGAPIALLYASMFMLFASVCMVGAANGAWLITHGHGASTTDIGIWRTCEAQADGSDNCYPVTSNSQCSELSSRMKAIGAFSILSVVAIFLSMGAFFAEGRGASFPVTHLTKIIYGWAVIFQIVCIGVAIGTLVAKLCNNPLALRDRNGQFGPAFYNLFGSLVVLVIGGGMYAGYKVKRDANQDSDDDAGSDDEAEEAMLQKHHQDLEDL